MRNVAFRSREATQRPIAFFRKQINKVLASDKAALSLRNEINLMREI